MTTTTAIATATAKTTTTTTTSTTMINIHRHHNHHNSISLGTIAMIPENVEKIQQYGGVAPMTTLMGLVANMVSCPNQEELLATFSSCINSVVESAVGYSSKPITDTELRTV